MITKNDCLMLLADINAKDIDTTEQMKELISSNQPSISVIKFINDNRQLDLVGFYEKLRNSYNSKKSKLYKNIMNELSSEDITEVITTLNSYALQACLFLEKVENKQMFMRFSRLEEVYKCLLKYSIDYDLTPSIKLLSLIKADIKVLESVYRK